MKPSTRNAVLLGVIPSTDRIGDGETTSARNVVQSQGQDKVAGQRAVQGPDAVGALLPTHQIGNASLRRLMQTPSKPVLSRSPHQLARQWIADKGRQLSHWAHAYDP